MHIYNSILASVGFVSYFFFFLIMLCISMHNFYFFFEFLESLRIYFNQHDCTLDFRKINYSRPFFEMKIMTP